MPKIYGFVEKDAARIERAVKRFEGFYRTPLRTRRAKYPIAAGGSSLYLADSGSGLSAGSRSSPTNTMVTLLELNGAGPGLTTSGTMVKCYNLSATEVAASKTIIIMLFAGNYYVVQVLDC